MAQTQMKDIFFPDGTQVLMRATYGVGDYTDLGVIAGDANAVLEFDENAVMTGNADETATQYKNMRITGDFELNSINPANLALLGGGLFTATTTAASALTTIPNQTIAAGWNSTTQYNLIAQTSSSNSHEVRLSAAPVLTSVVLNHGTPETLVEGTDYVISVDPNSSSGYSIQFIGANMTSADPTTYSITIDWGTNTPIASKGMTCGAATVVGSSVELKYLHTDAAGLKRYLYMPRVQANSGSFAFNFKGANADGLESMPFKFTAKLKTTVATGAQLFTWVIEDGAL